MFRKAALLGVAVCFAIPAIAQDRTSPLPENTIDCKQFRKAAPQEWIEVGIAVFDLGAIKDINLTNQPVVPGYFKFGGADLYDVLEQKCGTAVESNPGNITTQPLTAPEQNQHASASAPAPAQTNVLEVASSSNNTAVDSKSESTACRDKKLVYVADSVNGAEEHGALIEIVVSNNMNHNVTDSLHSEFVLREYKGNKIEWTYRGKIIQGNFVFTPLKSKRENSLFTQAHFTTQKPITLASKYVKPHRYGTDEAILYLGGLRALFSTRESAHRFRFEGNHSPTFLPEAFYFDRCE
jgi:hypothetical protein